MQATTYKNLATIYFDKTKYLMAGQYYDSTLTRLVKKNREYFTIVKKRENLVDVIKYEGIVQHNDSILNIVALSENDRKIYFDDYISKIKAKEEAKKLLEAKQKTSNTNTGIQDIVVGRKNPSSDPIFSPPGADFANTKDNAFYFYNPVTVNYGKVTFLKKWGKRALKDNWRWSTQSSEIKNPEDVFVKNPEIKTEEVPEKFQVDFYLKQLPTSQKVLDSLARERNFANYQLGVVYKEKFKEYALSASKFESLLKNKPEERLVLPSMYNLYKIYEIIDKNKAEIVKNQIITNYPNTRYAQILSGAIVEENTIAQTPEAVYKTIYKQFRNQEYVAVLEIIEKSLAQFAGDDLIPKFELLKSSAIGKLKGVDEYKKSLNFVALNFPNTNEGKQAEEILQTNIPVLEKMTFVNDTLSKNWKILYKAGAREADDTKTLIEKINKYIKEKQYDTFSVSYDVYNETENFVVIHGIKSKEYSNYFVNILKDTKDYKIVTPAQVISSENYSVIQAKKNYNQFIELK